MGVVALRWPLSPARVARGRFGVRLRGAAA